MFIIFYSKALEIFNLRKTREGSQIVAIIGRKKRFQVTLVFCPEFLGEIRFLGWFLTSCTHRAHIFYDGTDIVPPEIAGSHKKKPFALKTSISREKKSEMQLFPDLSSFPQKEPFSKDHQKCSKYMGQSSKNVIF